MATTPVLALPYPLGTDRVMDGDDAIHALALAIEQKVAVGRICGGTLTITPPAGSPTTATGTAVFPAGLYSSPPAVISSTQSMSSTFLCGSGVPTAAQCAIVLFRRDGAGLATTPVTVAWIAIGV